MACSKFLCSFHAIDEDIVATSSTITYTFNRASRIPPPPPPPPLPPPHLPQVSSSLCAMDEDIVAVPSTSTAPYIFSRAQQGPQVSPQLSPPPPPPPPPLPSHVPLQAQSLVKVSHEVQTSFTWLNDTPLWVPEMRVQKRDSEMQTFCTWIPLGWRK